MKKIYLLFVSLILLSWNTFAQVADFTLTDTKGNTHNLYSYLSSGKAVVLECFFLSCGNCQAAASRIDQLYKEYGSNNGDVIFIALEIQDATNIDIDAWKTTHGATFPACGGYGASNYWSNNVYPLLGGYFAQVMIIKPNAASPANSTIIYQETGSISNTKIQEMRDALIGNGFTDIQHIDASDIQIKLFPNPTTETINLEVNTIKIENSNLEIYNMMGQKLIESMVQLINGKNTITMDVRNLAKGNYLAKLIIDDSIKTIPFQIE